MSTSEILRAKELADLLGCAETTVEERARSGDLPGLKFGDGGWIFPREATFSRLNQLAMDEASIRRGSKVPPPGAQTVAAQGGKVRPVLPSLQPAG